ncbi:MAG: hypothetical protein JWQ63_1273 [Mucilaginibacter sp.]|jgi:hypothetical protein|nr:hypothetical protein [Mucilaginibacter sp.]
MLIHPFPHIKKLFLLFSFFLLVLNRTFAQTPDDILKNKIADSIKMDRRSAAAIQYPLLRQGFISTDITGAGNITAKLHGSDFFKAKEQITRVRANFNLPVAQWGKNRISANFNYLYQHIDISQVTNYNPAVPVHHSSNSFTTIGLTAGYTRVDTLFNHQVIFSANVSGVTDELSTIRRVNELVGVIVPIKQTATTVFSVGLFYSHDPTIQFPVIPLISYMHKFQTGDFRLFVDLPTRVLVKKQLSAKSWLSLGTELSESQSYLKLNEPLLPRNAINTTLELKTGPGYEYLIGKKLMIGINGGLLSTLSSRIFQQGQASSTYFIKNTNSAVPYIGFTVSFLPFIQSIISKR